MAVTWVLYQTPVKYLNWDSLRCFFFCPFLGGRRENLGAALKWLSYCCHPPVKLFVFSSSPSFDFSFLFPPSPSMLLFTDRPSRKHGNVWYGDSKGRMEMLPASLCVSGFAWQLLTVCLKLFSFSWPFSVMLGAVLELGADDGVQVLGGIYIVATISICCFSLKMWENLVMLEL